MFDNMNAPKILPCTWQQSYRKRILMMYLFGIFCFWRKCSMRLCLVVWDNFLFCPGIAYCLTMLWRGFFLFCFFWRGCLTMLSCNFIGGSKGLGICGSHSVLHAVPKIFTEPSLGCSLSCRSRHVTAVILLCAQRLLWSLPRSLFFVIKTLILNERYAQSRSLKKLC